MFRTLALACFAALLALPANAVPVRWTLTGEIPGVFPVAPGQPTQPTGQQLFSLDLSFTYDADLNEISDVVRGPSDGTGVTGPNPFSSPYASASGLNFGLTNAFFLTDEFFFYDIALNVQTDALLTNAGGVVSASASLIYAARTNFSDCPSISPSDPLYYYACTIPPGGFDAVVMADGSGLTLTGVPVSTVPLPAGFVLLLAGLGGLAVAGRRASRA